MRILKLPYLIWGYTGQNLILCAGGPDTITAIFHTKNCQTKNLRVKFMKSPRQEISRCAKKVHLLHVRICLTQTPNLEILSLRIDRRGHAARPTLDLRPPGEGTVSFQNLKFVFSA